MRNRVGRIPFVLLTSFVGDRYPNLGNGAGFKPPAFECLDGQFVEYLTAGALEHVCASHCSCRGINCHDANTTSAEIAAFHFVRVIRQRGGNRHGLGHRKRYRNGRRNARRISLHSGSRPFSRSRFPFGRHGDYCRLFRRKCLFGGSRRSLAWRHRGSIPVGLDLFLFRRRDLCWYFFGSRRGLLGYRCSVVLRRGCYSLGTRFAFLLFRLVNLNHLAGLELIRKIRRSRLLPPTHMRTGQANSSAQNEHAHGAGRHDESVRPA